MKTRRLHVTSSKPNSYVLSTKSIIRTVFLSSDSIRGLIYNGYPASTNIRKPSTFLQNAKLETNGKVRLHFVRSSNLKHYIPFYLFLKQNGQSLAKRIMLPNKRPLILVNTQLFRKPFKLVSASTERLILRSSISKHRTEISSYSGIINESTKMFWKLNHVQFMLKFPLK